MARTESGCIPCTNCCVTVPQDRWYAVERFGKFQKVLGPGLNILGFDCLGCCVGFRSITSRVDQNTVVVNTKTKDNVFVSVKVAVQQAVIPEAVEAAIYKLSDVTAQIDSFVSDVVRSHVPKMLLDEAFEKKDEISDAVQEQLQKNMATYGFTIYKALVTELTPDAQVAQSMNEINKQKRSKPAGRHCGSGTRHRRHYLRREE
mmetsp:Transcript_5059/g.7010  ORF Transcript_5059/g.7010 Transcript_5059/m.7010 type:complete len:203 (-) Transcript_5059:108-716(-)